MPDMVQIQTLVDVLRPETSAEFASHYNSIIPGTVVVLSLCNQKYHNTGATFLTPTHQKNTHEKKKRTQDTEIAKNAILISTSCYTLSRSPVSPRPQQEPARLHGNAYGHTSNTHPALKHCRRRRLRHIVPFPPMHRRLLAT